jgi:TPR repeat protein
MKYCTIVGFAVLFFLVPLLLQAQEGDAPQTSAIPVTESKRTAILTAAKALRAEDLPELHRKGEAGDAEAQLLLGLAYLDGRVVEKNAATSLVWISKAAEQGHPMAQNSLGIAYRDGRGTQQNHAEALRWMHKAADQNYSQAYCNLGLAYYNGQGVPENPAEAVNWFRKAVEHDNACGQTMLGVAYAQGRGVAKDSKQAIELYRNAAEQGDADGQLELAISYDMGFGIKRDAAQAARWYGAAADQDNLWAMYNLAVSYHNGEGVPKSKDEAEKWFKKASDSGWAPATYYLGKIYADKKFQTSPLTGSIAVELFEKSAEQGYSLGALQLADIFSSRLTAYHLWVPRDDAKACRWLLVARGLSKNDEWEWFRPDDSAIVRKELPGRIAKIEKKLKQGFGECEKSAAEWLRAHQTKPGS